MRFDGVGTYGGVWKYCNIIPRKGTVIDEIHADIPNPASYNRDTDTDTIKEHLTLQRLEDRAVVQPTYNGLLRYQGSIQYGDTGMPIIDMDMMRIVKPFRYDGKKKYYIMPYTGLVTFDGLAIYGGGETYKGVTIIEEVL